MSIFVDSYQVVASGVYSLPAIGTSPISIIFLLGFASILPRLFIYRSFYLMNKTIKIAELELKNAGILTQAKAKYKLAIYIIKVMVIASVLSSIPMFLLAMYEWITRNYPPIFLDGLTIISLVTNYSGINTILVIYLNPELHDIYIESFYKPAVKVICFSSSEQTKKQSLAVSTIQAVTKKLASRTILSPRNISFNEKIKFDKLHTWLIHEDLNLIFKEFCDKIFATENLLFYMEVNRYKDLVKKIELLIDLEHIDENEEYRLLWKKLYELQMNIYNVFIKVPSAPLEINISTSIRTGIIKIIFGNSNLPSLIQSSVSPSRRHSKVNRRRSTIRERAYSVLPSQIFLKLPDIKVIPIEENEPDLVPPGIENEQMNDETNVDKLTNLPSFAPIIPVKQEISRERLQEITGIYDSARDTIEIILERDIFLRFIKTSIFQETIEIWSSKLAQKSTV